jgi:hypothetical protein
VWWCLVADIELSELVGLQRNLARFATVPRCQFRRVPPAAARRRRSPGARGYETPVAHLCRTGMSLIGGAVLRSACDVPWPQAATIRTSADDTAPIVHGLNGWMLRGMRLRQEASVSLVALVDGRGGAGLHCPRVFSAAASGSRIGQQKVGHHTGRSGKRVNLAWPGPQYRARRRGGTSVPRVAEANHPRASPRACHTSSTWLRPRGSAIVRHA